MYRLLSSFIGRNHALNAANDALMVTCVGETEKHTLAAKSEI